MRWLHLGSGMGSEAVPHLRIMPRGHAGHLRIIVMRGEAVRRLIHHLVRMMGLRILVPHLTMRVLTLQLNLPVMPALTITLGERSWLAGCQPRLSWRRELRRR